MKAKRVAVLVGGRSAEREISLLTGEEIYQALTQAGYSAFKVEADDSVWESLKENKPDVVFIALHGRWGEDGTVQGMLELLGLPYTGSGVLASALGINKAVSKTIFQTANLDTPRFVVVRGARESENLGRFLEEKGYPVVVKPCREGSTIGLSVVEGKEGLAEALRLAAAYDNQIVVEEFVEGKEVTIGILGNDQLIAFPSLEICYRSKTYDYETKYTPGMSEHIIPARISQEQEKRAKEMALAVHQALGCRGFSRVDLIVAKDRICVLEVNTIPGMTSLSLFPDAARAAGIKFPELVSRIVELALEK
jgi:D-alanine-D-alanine ligase